MSLIPLDGATVDVNPETGYMFVRIGGYIQPVKLAIAEIDVLLAIVKLISETAGEEQRRLAQTAASRARIISNRASNRTERSQLSASAVA